MVTIFNTAEGLDVNGLIDLIVSFVLLTSIGLPFLRLCKKKFVHIFSTTCALVLYFGIICKLPIVSYIAIASLMVGVGITLFANFAEFKWFFASGSKGKTLSQIFSKKPAEKAVTIYDKSGVIDEITKAVLFLSNHGTGALITILRKDDILNTDTVEPIIKQKGIQLDAIVNAELLETIFYLGTRLHDGAVVIRDNKIVAGAVFYESTKRPLTGKYGARHQAAMGISENSDAVTIIVSEENSKISICHDLMMDVVPQDLFKSQLDYILSQDSPAKLKD